MAPGKYFVTVKYNGNNVRGSPFTVRVQGDNLTAGNTSPHGKDSQQSFHFFSSKPSIDVSKGAASINDHPLGNTILFRSTQQPLVLDS